MLLQAVVACSVATHTAIHVIMAEAANPCSSSSDSSHTSDTSDRERESTGGIPSEGKPSISTGIIHTQSRGLLSKTQRAMAEQDELNSSFDEEYTTDNASLSSDEEPQIRSGRHDRSGLPTIEKLVQMQDLVRTKGKRQREKKGVKYISTQPPLQGSQKEERNRSEGIFEQTKDVSEDENYEGKKVDKELHQCLDPAPDRKSQSYGESHSKVDIKSEKMKRVESKHAAKKGGNEGKDKGERKMDVYREDSENESICVEAAKPRKKRKRNISSISGTALNEHHSGRHHQSVIEQMPIKGGYVKSRSMTRAHSKPESKKVDRKKRKEYHRNISVSPGLQVPTPSSRMKVLKPNEVEHESSSEEIKNVCLNESKAKREAHHGLDDERRPKEHCKHEYMSSSDVTSESGETDDDLKIESSENHHKQRHKSSSGSTESSISSSSSYSKYDKRKRSMRRKPISKGRKKQAAVHKRKKQYFKHGEKKGKGKMKQHKTVCSSSESSASDSDSSSKIKPEQFQRKEGRSLRNVFRYQFGKLCSVITDPLNLATHLREKGLISSSMMDKVLTTPNSQQEKTILLMCALERRIKSNPENLFIFIEILMENVVLQEHGKEMWKKAGKL